MKRVGASSELQGHRSIRFEVGTAPSRFGPVPLEGFALRSADGIARGYLNICPHRGQPVDLGDGKLFTKDGRLECQAHGAYFDPASGVCIYGPCRGRALRPLDLSERDGELWVDELGLDPVPDPEPITDEDLD